MELKCEYKKPSEPYRCRLVPVSAAIRANNIGAQVAKQLAPLASPRRRPFMLIGSEIVIHIGRKPLLVLREVRGEQVGRALRASRG